jgi:ABC-2 type transport system ATP-binding protein
MEGLDKLKGIYEITKTATGVSFHLDTEHFVNVVNHINQFGVTKLESVPPSLEELIMTHYKKAN